MPVSGFRILVEVVTDVAVLVTLNLKDVLPGLTNKALNVPSVELLFPAIILVTAKPAVGQTVGEKLNKFGIVLIIEGITLLEQGFIVSIGFVPPVGTTLYSLPKITVSVIDFVVVGIVFLVPSVKLYKIIFQLVLLSSCHATFNTPFVAEDLLPSVCVNLNSTGSGFGFLHAKNNAKANKHKQIIFFIRIFFYKFKIKMYNSKLFELISSLSIDEQKKLLEFLPLSTLSNHAILYKLIDFTIKQLNAKKGNVTSLERQKVYQYVFPKETYNEHKINKLLSDGNKAIEAFIIYLSISNDLLYHKIAIIDFYQKKGLYKYFENEILQTEKLINAKKESDLKMMSYIQLNSKKYEYETFKNTRQANFQIVYDSIKNYSQLAEIKFRNYTLINLHTDLETKECTNILYQIHFIIHKLLNQHQLTEEFEVCYQMILNNKELIDADELRDCVTLLIAISIKQVHDAMDNAKERLFNLFAFLIDNNLVLEKDNSITSAIYKNVTTIGLYINRISYVDNFIETYKNNLPEEVQEDVYSYNKAHLLYYKKEYNNVLQLISTTKYKDVFYRLDSRVLLIKTYYALEKTDASYFDILNNSINAFKKYVYTNEELNDYYKTRYKNFIKSVLKLIQLNSDKTQIQKYIEELNANKDVLEHKWLIDSANEMLLTK